MRERRGSRGGCYAADYMCAVDDSIVVLAGYLYWYLSGNVTSAGWQVTLCDPMWHVSSRSGVATLRTAIHLLLKYRFQVLVLVVDV